MDFYAKRMEGIPTLIVCIGRSITALKSVIPPSSYITHGWEAYRITQDILNGVEVIISRRIKQLID